MAVPNLVLNNGHKMPILGLGTWKSKPGAVEAAVADAIDAGYRHIDCAMVYQNEKEVGAAIKSKIDSGVVKREDLFIVSKLWNTYHDPALVESALRTSMTDLGVDYLDLYLIHWPMAYKENSGLFPKDEHGKFIYSDVDYLESWKVLEECIRKGLVKSIGVSNFNSQQLQRVLDICTIKPVTNQVECHPYLNQSKLIDYCKERGVTVTAYSPLLSPDRPWAKPGDPVLLEEPKLKELALKHKKTIAQLLLRYQVERGVAVIPKTVTKSRILENIDIFDFSLSAEDLALVDSLNRNWRHCDELGTVDDHPHFPFLIEF